MILADHILAARGTPLDIHGTITSFAASLETAERFVLSDDIGMAGYQLIQSKPASLLDAMPLCRLPYPSMWFEWGGTCADLAGWNQFPTCEPPGHRDFARPIPWRMGCLVEGEDNGQRGQMTWAWMHKASGVNVCGLGVNFDWSKDGDVIADARRALGSPPTDTVAELFMRRWLGELPDAGLDEVMRLHKGWGKIANDPKQREAVRGLLRHERSWFSTHAHALVSFALDNMPEDFLKLVTAWEGDICGEAPFVAAVVLMLNSRNAVDREPADLGKLNRARRRRGRVEFLPHTVTRLHLSHARMRNAEASGMTREAMRQHIVRGHFKIRKTGVYWWTPFLRGDAARPSSGTTTRSPVTNLATDGLRQPAAEALESVGGDRRHLAPGVRASPVDRAPGQVQGVVRVVFAGGARLPSQDRLRRRGGAGRSSW